MLRLIFVTQKVILLIGPDLCISLIARIDINISLRSQHLLLILQIGSTGKTYRNSFDMCHSEKHQLIRSQFDILGD